MSTPIVITTAAVQYASATTEVHCTIQADTVLGPSTTQRVLPLASDALPPDWTDADLCAAVAEAFDVDVADVSVAGDAAMRNANAIKAAA
jgi:hypothetical protein